MSDKIFEVDFKKVVLNFLPKFFRRKRIFALFDTFTLALRTVYLIFLSKRFEDNKELEITPQVYSLRKVLNDYFDSNERSIRIEDSSTVQRTYIFTSGEKNALYLGKVPLYSSDAFRFSLGFVVIAPERLNNVQEEARMSAMINKYKLAGTKYIIKYE